MDVVKRMRVDPYYQGPLSWQLAEAYLLMKSCFNPLLSDDLQRTFSDEFEYFKMILLQQLEDRMNSFIILNNVKSANDVRFFLKTGVIRKTTLYEYLFEMKTNLELKMLAHFYGGAQILFPTELQANDGTGCMFLDGKDTKKKLQTLFEHVPEGIIIGLGHHWLAVQGMEQLKKDTYNFIIHDPQGQKKTVSSENIEKHFRFYVFQFDMVKRKEQDAIIRQALKLPLRKRPPK